MFPLVLVIGGAVSIYFSGETNLWNTTKVNPPWKYLAAFGLLAAAGIAGAMLSGISIFLPGLLLIFFIYPAWEDIKKIKAIKVSLRGINAIAGGMITAAAIVLVAGVIV